MFKPIGIQIISWNGIRFKPIKLTGDFNEGYALDIHIKKSEFLGVNQFGQNEYDNTRTQIGEMVYQLKYQSDLSQIDSLVGLSVAAIKDLILTKNTLDCIIPVPPSNDDRLKQPVLQVAKKIAEILGVPYYDTLLEKSIHTDQMKNIAIEDRKDKLKDVFTLSKQDIKYNNVLLFDDLFQSGSTVNECVKVLKNSKKDLKVFLLTMTKTGNRYYYG